MDDPIEALFAKGVTDGLPVVPPTPDRVRRLLGGTARAPDELVALVPPNYGRATVEKIAVNAVMAGCLPEYLPVVIAAVEAVCEEKFDIHGVSATTNSAWPLLIVNGPIRPRIGLNAGAGVFGPGFRANATIGRALRLILVNLGGARPGEISMSTFGHPGRYTSCIAENEEASPWEPFHLERGFPREASTVTAFAAQAPLEINEHACRTAETLVTALGWSMAGLWSYYSWPLNCNTLLVLSPEHARTIADSGWSKSDIRRFLYEQIRLPAEALGPARAAAMELMGGGGRDAAGGAGGLVPKFPTPDSLLIMVAGGTAGRFSAALAGWIGFEAGSQVVTRVIAE
jgi:hypothetical protein